MTPCGFVLHAIAALAGLGSQKHDWDGMIRVVVTEAGGHQRLHRMNSGPAPGLRSSQLGGEVMLGFVEAAVSVAPKAHRGPPPPLVSAENGAGPGRRLFGNDVVGRQNNVPAPDAGQFAAAVVAVAGGQVVGTGDTAALRGQPASARTEFRWRP